MQQGLNGIIVIDKPANITSAGVVAMVKKNLRVKKAGHTGTLDPFATGVMICCINKATKLARFFLGGNKKYEGILHLGVETDTQDLTGTVIATCDKVNFSEKTIISAFERFEGDIRQVPPVYSALKHNGIPLYRLARSGRPVQKPARCVFISYINIIDINFPDIRFEVSCSSGTYIRTLCADIGKLLGCGGHLKQLRRIECSGFTIKEAITLSALNQKCGVEKFSSRLYDQIISMSDALRDMPEQSADKILAEKIMHGKTITKKDFISVPDYNFGSMPDFICGENGFVKIVDENKDLIAVLNLKKDGYRYEYCSVFNN